MPSSLQNLLRKLQWSDFGTPQKKPAPGAGQSAVAAHTATTHKPFNWALMPVPGSKPTLYKLAGNINVNGVTGPVVELPFGGFKESGFGRDRSLHAIDKYSDLKNVVIRTAR